MMEPTFPDIPTLVAGHTTLCPEPQPDLLPRKHPPNCKGDCNGTGRVPTLSGLRADCTAQHGYHSDHWSERRKTHGYCLWCDRWIKAWATPTECDADPYKARNCCQGRSWVAKTDLAAWIQTIVAWDSHFFTKWMRSWDSTESRIDGCKIYHQTVPDDIPTDFMVFLLKALVALPDNEEQWQQDAERLLEPVCPS